MGRTAGYSRKDYNYRMDPYIGGNTVRKPERVPQPGRPPREEDLRSEPQKQEPSQRTQRNRQRALQLNFGYVFFLAVAAAAMLYFSVQFLQMQAESMSHRKTITDLEKELSEVKMNNDAEYKRVSSSADLEKIKDIAINELGMVYAGEGQVITYNNQEEDYVKQYGDVPTE